MGIIINKQFELAQKVIQLHEEADKFVSVADGVEPSLRAKFLRTRGEITLLTLSLASVVGGVVANQAGLPFIPTLLFSGISGATALALCKTSKMGALWKKVSDEYYKQLEYLRSWRNADYLPGAVQSFKKDVDEWGEVFADYPMKFQPGDKTSYNFIEIDDFKEDVASFCKVLDRFPKEAKSAGLKALHEIRNKLTELEANTAKFDVQLKNLAQQLNTPHQSVLARLIENCRRPEEVPSISEDKTGGEQ